MLRVAMLVFLLALSAPLKSRGYRFSEYKKREMKKNRMKALAQKKQNDGLSAKGIDRRSRKPKQVETAPDSDALEDADVRNRFWEQQNPEDFMGKRWLSSPEQDAIREDPSKADDLIRAANNIIENQDSPRRRRQSTEVRQRKISEMQNKIRAINAFLKFVRRDTNGKSNPKPPKSNSDSPIPTKLSDGDISLMNTMKNNSGLRQGMVKQYKEWISGNNPVLAAKGRLALAEMKRRGYLEAG